MASARGSRVLRSAASLCLLTGLLGAWPVGRASAGCAGPVLAVGPVVDEAAPVEGVLVRGATVTVSGVGFRTGCDDTGQGSGCGAPESEESPLTDVTLVLEQGATSVPLGVADAGEPDQGYPVSWRVRVPAGLSPGPAVLHAAGAQLTVEVRP